MRKEIGKEPKKKRMGRCCRWWSWTKTRGQER